MKSISSLKQPPKPLNVNVRVIGDRSSGKTTYMAALARHPNADPTTSAVQSVIPLNPDGETLLDKAKNVLEQGESLEPTPLETQPGAVKDYWLRITLKKQLAMDKSKNGKAPLLSLDITCKDYAGEFFRDILFQSGSLLLQNYMDDCVQADGIMLLTDGTAFTQDDRYAQGLERFLRELENADMTKHKRRIALVLTKCEHPQLWVNRQDPHGMVKSRFPRLLQQLQVWEQMKKGEFDCFATSAFGMVNANPSPNMTCEARDREGVKVSFLKYPRRWKPFGLVAPIYWLCTGKRHPQLDYQ